MMRLWLNIGFALVSGAAVCWGQGDPAPASDAKPASAASPTSSDPAASRAVSPQAASEGKPTPPPPAAGASDRYVIGPLDVIYIGVWNNPQLTGARDVQPDGMISVPLVGEVKADGMTAVQLKDSLKTRLSEFLTNPEVDVQVSKINSKRYYVYGGVIHPGEFPLIAKTTVMDALSMVEGFKDFANTKKIRILRGSETFNFNYKDVSRGKNMEQNIELQTGDRIFVPE